MKQIILFFCTLLLSSSVFGQAVQIGSSYNIYSILLESQNQVHYDPDLNALVFVHRQNDGATGGSGILSYDISFDGGATWDATTKQMTPNLVTSTGNTINGNRYPNGTIYNPPGNTDPANARVVAVSAALHTDPVNGNGWGYECVAATDMSGNVTEESYYSTADTNSYIPFGLTANADGSLWYTVVNRDPQGANRRLQFFNPLILRQLTFNSTTGLFDTTNHELTLDYTGLFVDNILTVRPNLAFSPDGTTGYAIVRGTDALQNTIGAKPIIWKTVDAGDSWIRQKDIDYQQFDTLINYTVPVDADGDGQSDPVGTAPQIPYMQTCDAVVDANGDLHLIAVMSSRSDTANVHTIWVGLGTENLFHFRTNGACWSVHHIDNYNNEDGTVNATAVDVRPQATRSADGSKVIFTYTKTDTLATGITNNNAPDLWGYGFDVNTEMITGTKNLGVGTDAEFTCYYPTISPVCISNGSTFDYEIPTVYGVPRDLADDLAPIDYFYLPSVGFNNSEFIIPIDAQDTICFDTTVLVDIDVVLPIEDKIVVAPNPTDGKVLIDLGSNLLNRRLEVTDIQGRTVLSTITGNTQIELDLSNQASGIYFIRIQQDNYFVVKKLSLTK